MPPEADSSEPDRPRRHDAEPFFALLARPGVGLLLCLIIAFLWSSAPVWLRPETIFNESFIVYEHGHNLFVVDQILAGKRLYRDIFSPYGVLPAYLHAAWAACFGNTAGTYVALMQLLTLINVGLLYRLLRRSVSSPVALGWLVVAVFPFILLPGSFNAGMNGMLYPGCERLCLLLIALLWVDPRVRSHRRALLMGGVLGAMQWVKFGGAFMAGAALLITDLLILRRSLTGWEGVRGRLGMMLYTLAGFLAVELLWVAVACLALPPAIARDVLWPSYMLKNYAVYASVWPRYVNWMGLRYFVEAQLPTAIALPLNAALIWRFAVRRNEAVPADVASRLSPEGPLVFFACYYPLAVAFYLPHVWSQAASAWIFIAAGVYFFRELRLPMRGLVVLALLPSFLVSVKSVLPVSGRPAGIENVALPDGQRLWLTPDWKDCVAKTQAVLAQLAARRPPAEAAQPPYLLIFPVGSGWLHYFSGRPLLRHTYMSQGLVRPLEQVAMADALSKATAVMVFSETKFPVPIQANPGTWGIMYSPGFDPEINAAVARQLDAPIQVDDHCTIFPVKRSPGTSETPTTLAGSARR